MAENKTKPTERSVEDFLAAIPDAGQRSDCRTLMDLMSRVTKAPAVMWGPSIVGFGRYSYTYASGRSGEWMLVGFSPRKGKLSVYLTDGVAKHQDDLAVLGPHATGKSCLYLRKLEQIDLGVLERMLENSVQRQR